MPGNKCKTVECLIPHCGESTIGTPEKPFAHGYFEHLSYKHPQGPQGFKGENGSQGMVGKTGNTGMPGPRGWQGPKSCRGFQGKTGQTGNQGKQGKEGEQGKRGKKSKIPGPQGPAGENNNNNNGAQGPIGMTGTQGPRGPSGGGDGNDFSLLLFGNDASQPLAPKDVLIHVPTGNFLQHASSAEMTWQTIIDDSSDGNAHMYATCLSLDGLTQFVVRFTSLTGRLIFRSVNGGATFSPTESPRGWNSIACSYTANVVMASAISNTLYVSTDFGLTYAPRASIQAWQNVCISSTGLVAMACTLGGNIYTSEDTGLTWTPRDIARNWQYITCSADGIIGFACTDNGMFLSIDTGHTWVSVGPALSMVSVGLSGDGTSVLYGITNLGICYFSTDMGNFFDVERINVVDKALSFDATKVLFLNTDNTSSYSQDSGSTFQNTLQPLGFQRNVAMTTSGLYALSISNDFKHLLFGTAQTGNVIKFNSLVSDTAVTAKLLTNLAPVPGRLAATDSILQGFGKLIRFTTTVFSGSGVTATIDAPQGVGVLVGFLVPTFQEIAGGFGFTFDAQQGAPTFNVATTTMCNVSIVFAVRSFSSTTDVQFGISGGGPVGPHCRITLTTGWQVGTIQTSMQMNLLSSVQLYALQTNEFNSNMEFTAITYCIT